MTQIVDLQNDAEFQSLGVQLISIAQDPVTQQAPEAVALGITDVPMLADPTLEVSEAYGVLAYALESGEPSHTFVLVDAAGQVVAVADYGAPDNPNRTMYVPVNELTSFVRENLGE